MKIGSYSVPTYSLESLLIATKSIYETLGGKEANSEFIADVLGHAPKSGSFATKMADLKSYGLIEGRGSNIRVSELGKLATGFGQDVEQNEALLEIVRNIDLWRELLDRYDVNIKKENFWAILAQITGAERLIAKKKADSVRKAYLEAVEYIKSVGEPTETIPLNAQGDIEAAGRISAMETQSTTGLKTAILYIKYPDRSETRYEIKTEEDYQVGESLFKAIRTKLALKEAKSEEDKELATKILAAIQPVLDARKKDTQSESGSKSMTPEELKPEEPVENEKTQQQ